MFAVPAVKRVDDTFSSQYAQRRRWRQWTTTRRSHLKKWTATAVCLAGASHNESSRVRGVGGATIGAGESCTPRLFQMLVFFTVLTTYLPMHWPPTPPPPPPTFKFVVPCLRKRGRDGGGGNGEGAQTSMIRKCLVPYRCVPRENIIFTELWWRCDGKQ